MSDQATAFTPGAVRYALNLQRFAEGDGEPETIAIDGLGEFTPDELKELVSKGRDYTKKTQELSSQRNQLESDLKLIEKYGDFMRGIDADEEAQLEISKTIDSINQRRQGGEVATQGQVNRLQKQAEESDSDGLRDLVEEIRLEREIESLQKKFGDDFNSKEVLQYSIDNEIEDLEKAYKLMNYDKLAERASGNNKQAQVNKSVPRTLAGKSGAAPSTAPTKPKTWGEASAAALEMLGSYTAE